VRDFDHLLTREEVASYCNWSTPATVSRYLSWTRQRIDAGEALTSNDFPMPVRIIARSPLWERGDLDRWLATRPGRGHGLPTFSQHQSDVSPANFLANDVVWIDGQKLLVRQVFPDTDMTRVRLARSRRESGRWRSLSNADTFNILRPTEREQ
jgi:predicted DNA-binding transcriptional regulator AlpA